MGFSRQEHWSGLPFPSPKGTSERKKVKSLQLFATPWTVAYQTPPSMEFSRQEYWSRLPFPSIYRHIHIYLCIIVVQSLSCDWLFVTPYTGACQAPLSSTISQSLLKFMYLSGLSFTSPGHLPNPGIKPESPALPVGSLPRSHLGSSYLCIHTFLYCMIYFIIPS